MPEENVFEDMDLQELLDSIEIDDPTDPEDATEVPNAEAAPSATVQFSFQLDTGQVLEAKSGQFTLARGVEPSVATMTCDPNVNLNASTEYWNNNYLLGPGNTPDWQAYDQVDHNAPGLPTFDGTLFISDGLRVLSFPGCRIAELTAPYTNTSVDWSVTIRDVRWRWPYQTPVSGEFNRQDENQNLITAGTFDGGLSRQYQGTKTAKELAEILGARLGYGFGLGALGFDASGLPGTDSTAGTDTSYIYPHVKWDMTPSGEALQDIVDRYGCSLSLAPTLQGTTSGTGTDAGTTIFDAVYIYGPNGTAVFGGPPIFFSNAEAGLNNPFIDYSIQEIEYQWQVQDVPGAIIIDCGPDRMQAELPLTAVGLDLDGQWKPVADMLLEPTYGWTPAEIQKLEKLDDWEDSEKVMRTVFRCYQLPESAQFPPFNAAGSGDLIASPNYLRTELMERLSPHLVLTGTLTDDGELRYIPPYISGRHRTNADLGKSITNAGTGAAEYDAGTDQRVKVSWSIDRANNVIRFSEPIFALTGDATGTVDLSSAKMVDPNLSLTAVWNAERYSVEKYAVGGNPSNNAYRVKRDDIHRNYIHGVLINNLAVLDAATAYAREIQRTFRAISTPVTATFQMLQLYWPDGLLEEVTFSVDNTSVPTTVCSWGVKHTLDNSIFEESRNRMIKRQVDAAAQQINTNQHDYERSDIVW